MHLRSILLVALFMAGTASGARAQCPAWEPGLHIAGMDAPVFALTPFDDGTGRALYFGGEFLSAFDRAAARIARFDGTGWSDVAGGMDGAVYALLVHDDGSGPALFAAGAFLNAGGVPANRIARWDGASWSPVGAGLGSTVRSLASYDDGLGQGPTLYAGGDFAGGIARWDGTQWTTPAGGLIGGNPNEVLAFAVYDDGLGPRPALYAAGQFHTAGGNVQVDNIARYDGSAWTSPSTGIAGTVRALTTFDDGSGLRLFAGGQFQHAGGTSVQNLAAWNGVTWGTSGTYHSPIFALDVLDAGSGPRLHAAASGEVERLDGSVWIQLGLLGAHALAAFDDGSGPKLFAGGTFITTPIVPAYRVARLDGSGWNAPGAGGGGLPELGILSLATHDDGAGRTLFAGGSADYLSSGVDRWNGSSWTPIAGGPGFAETLASFDGGAGAALYVAGLQSATPSVMRWDGSTWSTVATSSGYFFRLSVLDDGSGEQLYAAGSFLSITPAVGPPIPASCVARWDGAHWSAFGSGLSANFYALAVFDDGQGGGPAVYAAGDMHAPWNGIARWDGSAWLPVGGGFTTVPAQNRYVNDLAVYDDGSGSKLYACGRFSTAGGLPAHFVARWDGTSWSEVGGGFDDLGWAFRVFDDGNGAALYASGLFHTAGANPVDRLARWNGAAWSRVGAANPSTANGYEMVNALAVWDDGPGGTTLWAGGTFPLLGGLPSIDIARFRACDSTGTAYCAGDGSATACPCGNSSPPGSNAGCINSLGRAGALRARGLASLSADSLVLEGSGMTNAACLYYQGSARAGGGAGVVFGDGLRCASGTVVRLGIELNASGSSHYPGAADASVSVQGLAHAGERREYQVWYRDAASWCTSATFDLTNGLEITWQP